MRFSLLDQQGRVLGLAEAVGGAARADVEFYPSRRVRGFKEWGEAAEAEREDEGQMKRLTETFRGLGLSDPERAARGRDGGQLPLVRVSPQLTDSQLQERTARAQEYATSIQEADKQLTEALVRAGFIEPRGSGSHGDTDAHTGENQGSGPDRHLR